MLLFCHQRQKSNQKNAAQGERGLVREKANMPHFLALRHPLPLRNPSLLLGRLVNLIDVKTLLKVCIVAMILLKLKALSRKRPFRRKASLNLKVQYVCNLNFSLLTHGVGGHGGGAVVTNKNAACSLFYS